MSGFMGAWGGLYNTEKTSRDSTATYYTLMDSDRNRVCEGGLVEGFYSTQLSGRAACLMVLGGELVKEEPRKNNVPHVIVG